MQIRVLVDNRVRVEGILKLGRPVVTELRSAFEHDNPDWIKKKRMRLATWSTPRTIVTWSNREDPNVMSFPRGGLGKVLRILSDTGFDTEVKDLRQYGVECPTLEHRRVLYPYQVDLVSKAIEMEQCIVRAPTGSGKTTALLAIAAQVQVPTLVIVHPKALLKQWEERVVSELGIEERNIGIIQGKNFDLRPITLSIQKTLSEVAAKSEEVRNYFGCVIADECHMFGARTFIESVDPFPARYRIGASADHRRKDRKEFLIHDLFGDVAADISRDSLIKSQHVLDVEIRMIPTTFAAPWYGFSDDKNAEVKIDFVRLVKEMAEDPARNWEIFRIVRDEVAAGEQVLVMCHEREHCMRIAQALTGMGIRAGHLLGGPESAKEFEQTVEDLKSKKLKVGVGTYKAIGTGIDIPAVGVAVAATPIASNQQFFGQVRGRVCRISKGKTTARLYVMWDSNVYERHLKNVITWNNLVVVRDEAGAWIPATTYIKDLGI